MSRHRWTLEPTKRVRFTGQLRMTSALHIGSGSESSLSDAGVVRHQDGRPFIPGSSLKGVLRSHLERLGQVLPGVSSCMLYSEDQHSGCVTPDWVARRKDVTEATESDFKKLCHTCTLFGSPIMAGKIRVPDLEIDESTFAGQTEVRDGVGIDRDSGLAVDQVKYDFEVVPSDTLFTFQLDVDSPDDTELALIIAGIREMEQGYISVGGKTTRGLGSCVLEGLEVFETDFGDMDSFKDFLKTGQPAKMTNPKKYMADMVDTLF